MVEDRKPGLRASDADRQAVVDVLAAAFNDGRLKIDEYTERMGFALEAVTRDQLAGLYTDLTPAGPLTVPAPVAASPQQETGLRGFIAAMPTALKVLWTIWLSAVSINVVVWLLVCVTSVSLVYPWPLWVAGPAGAALAAVSAGVVPARRSSQARKRAERAAREAAGLAGRDGKPYTVKIKYKG
jgi:Domain of unknown function (DUF1707)